MNNLTIPKEDEINRFVLSKLSESYIDVADILGIFCMVIYSRSVFSTNKDCALFLGEVSGEEIPNYISKSRALMVARVTKLIYFADKHIQDRIINKMVDYFSTLENSVKTLDKAEPKKTRKSKRNANDKLETWLKEL